MYESLVGECAATIQSPANFRTNLCVFFTFYSTELLLKRSIPQTFGQVPSRQDNVVDGKRGSPTALACSRPLRGRKQIRKGITASPFSRRSIEKTTGRLAQQPPRSCEFILAPIERCPHAAANGILKPRSVSRRRCRTMSWKKSSRPDSCSCVAACSAADSTSPPHRSGNRLIFRNERRREHGLHLGVKCIHREVCKQVLYCDKFGRPPHGPLRVQVERTRRH